MRKHLKALVARAVWEPWDQERYLWYLHSPTWDKVRAECRALSKGKCYICGFHYRKRGGYLQCNHVRYRLPDGSLIFGKENPRRDLFMVCDKHHQKGLYTWEMAYRDKLRWIVWRTLTFPFRLILFGDA